MSHLPEINARIIAVLSELGFSSHNAFARSINVHSQRMSNIATGRNKPDIEFCKQILLHHSDISGDWLLTGVGFMLKSEARKHDHASPKLQKKSTIVDNKIQPIVDKFDPELEAIQLLQDELDAVKQKLVNLVQKDKPHPKQA